MTSGLKCSKPLEKKVCPFKRVENMVAKMKLLNMKKILLLPQCFQSFSATEVSESVCMWESHFNLSLSLLLCVYNAASVHYEKGCFSKAGIHLGLISVIFLSVNQALH